MNKLIKVSVFLAGTFIVANQAFSWGPSDIDPTNKNGALRRGAKDIDPTNPNGSMGQDLHAKLNICNETQGVINYNVSGRNATIQPGYCDDWTTRGQAPIEFANMYHRRGTKRYVLNDGNYAFRPVRWNSGYLIEEGIDLVQK